MRTNKPKNKNTDTQTQAHAHLYTDYDSAEIGFNAETTIGGIYLKKKKKKEELNCNGVIFLLNMSSPEAGT